MMDPETAPKPAVAAPELEVVYDICLGPPRHKCSTSDFLTHMPGSRICREVLKGNYDKDKDDVVNRLSVFWYPTEVNSSIQHKIMSLLLHFDIESLVPFGGLVQFWAARKGSDGQISSLTTSDQPFGLDALYNGLCRYRYHCVRNRETRDGPIWRAFTQGCIQFCPFIEMYDTREFPLRDYAIGCGMRNYSYCAIPLFERHQRQHCIGVLEFYYYPHIDYYDPTELPLISLEDKGLITASTTSHFDDFMQWEEILDVSLGDAQLALRLVREEFKLPLVQLWVTCNCKCDGHDDSTPEVSKAPHLFCFDNSCNWGINYSYQFAQIKFVPEAYFVKSGGQTCIGRAHSLNKASFHRNTSKFCISEYPPVPLIRSGLRACFAIPMNLIHPLLPPFILEIFLPPLQKCHTKDIILALLKSLLTKVAQVFSTKNPAFGLTQHEEFCVEFSPKEGSDFHYFNVHRRNTSECLENITEEHRVQLSPQPPDYVQVQNYSQTNDAAAASTNQRSILALHPNTQDGPPQAFNTNADSDHAQKISYTIENGELQVSAAENMGGYHIQGPETILGNTTEEQQFPSSDTPPTLEADDHINTQDTAENSKKRIITVEMLKPYLGTSTQQEAADGLGVHVSTVKRRWDESNQGRWPTHKRNKVHQIQPIPKLSTKSAANSIPKTAEGKSTVTGNDDIDQSYGPAIVEAVYRDDTARFRFGRDSRIEDLRRELDKRFELKGERFKIKYKDEDGKWILMSCDEDLHFHMEALETSRQTKMELSISPVTY